MKLVSWNIQRGRGLQGPCSITAVVDALKAVADADVFCLQEVSAGYTDFPGADGGNQFMQLARLLQGYTPIAGVAVDTLGEAGARLLFGNMIFSRFPVVQVLRHALPWPADPGTMSMQRGALEATLDTPLGPVRVVNTHLEYFSLRQRASQVERLRELHLEAAGETHAARPGAASDGPFRAVPRGRSAILCGDFNFRPFSAQHLRLQAPFDDGIAPYIDAWNLCHPGLVHQATVCLNKQDESPFTSDFIFASADLAGRVRALKVASEVLGPDHQPLLIELD